jgi:hypothetical protein
MSTETTIENWTSAWPDALAFAVGLAVAWWANWNAGDLVWSLWLSSLVVGYSMIVWTIAQPAFEVGRSAWREAAKGGNPASAWPLWAFLLIGALFGLAFFTVHFGMFHYGHSQLLISFFPIDTGAGAQHANWADKSTYAEVVRRYWSFLPAAFLAERAAFMKKPLSLPLEWDRSPAGVEGRRVRAMNALESHARVSAKPREVMWAPYRNVARMHMLIFFFFFAHFAKLENFAVYTVVYAVYFFPWRLVRRSAVEPAPA